MNGTDIASGPGQTTSAKSLSVVPASDAPGATAGNPLTVQEQQAPAYEDGIAGVAKVEQRGTYQNITTATTTVVKSGPGFLYGLLIGTPAASATITIYDNTAGSGTKITTITMPAALLSSGPIPVPINVAFSTGLTIVTTGTTEVTVSFR